MKRGRFVPGFVVGLTALAMVVVPTQAAQANADVVTNCGASASTSGSLPYEVANASPGDTITFALSPVCTAIDLGATLDISNDLTVTGPGASALTVNGTGSQSVVATGPGTVTISGLSIEGGGGSGNGGGIDNTGTLTVLDSTVSNNAAGSGGGIFNDSDGTLTVENSTVSGNAASSLGGGIENQGTATVEYSTVGHNTASFGGGGIGIDTGGGSEPTTIAVTNSTLADNGATDVGGGIWINDVVPAPSVAATITSTTLWNNSAAIGGGIADNQGPVALGATIVAASPSGGDCFVEPDLLSDLGYNLDDDGTCGLVATGDLSATPAGLDPTGLQGNGGPTQTVALESGSAAIDQVSNAAQCPATDQRGVPRTAPCDIGAYDTDVAVVVPCTIGTSTCSATITAPSQTVDITGTKPVTNTASISIAVATAVLNCPQFNYAAPVATLFDNGLKTGSTVTITDTVNGLPSAKGVVVCYQPSGTPAPLPVFLKKCHGKKPVACYKSVIEVGGVNAADGGDVVVTLQVPAGDPRFHVGAEAPEVTALSPTSAAPGKKLTIKGLNLSEVTTATVDGVRATITKTAKTKVTVTVPPGAKSGPVRVTSLAGASNSISLKVT